MSEKHVYQPADASWHPSHAPADTSRMGHQAVPPTYGGQPQYQSYGTQPMMATQAQQAAPVYQISAQICPVTGGAHQETSRPGAIGLIIGILFCPIGCIAVCFDQKRTCRQCNAVIEEAWGGC